MAWRRSTIVEKLFGSIERAPSIGAIDDPTPAGAAL